MFRTIAFMALILLTCIACSTENPLCTDNYCVEGEIFVRSELGDREFSELPATVNEERILGILTPDDTFDRGNWDLLVTLPRRNLSPAKFRMVDEWIDPITEAYVDGKDFLFIIYTPKKQVGPSAFTYGIYQARYYLESPGLLHTETQTLRFHFPDPDTWWFQYWGNAAFQDRTQAGFTVEFSTTPMLAPRNGVERTREYLHGPEFGTTLDGQSIAGQGAPEIREGLHLKIYVR